MLSTTAMWIIGAVILLLPFALTQLLNGTTQSDARGRRISRSWRGRPRR